MIEARLQNLLGPLARMQRHARLFLALARCWSVAAVGGLALLLIEIAAGRILFPHIWITPLVIGVALAGFVLMRHKTEPDDIAHLSRQLELHDTQVKHLLLSAAEQKPADDSDAFTFLQLRVIDEVLTHPRQTVWRKKSRQRLASAALVQGIALLTLATVVIVLSRGPIHGASALGSQMSDGISVTPGDVQVERGTALVIAARFEGAPPAEATLVLNSGKGKESRIGMARRLADPVFGASVPEISEAGFYHIEYRGKKTRDFKIAVFEYPALVRADASLVYPSYTGLTNQTIRDTLRVSAVEGSRLGYVLQLNKPVAVARWVNDSGSLALLIQSNAVAALPELVLTNSVRFSLELVDAEGRSNRFPSDFVLQALTNQRPEVKLLFPRGDPRVSRLQELQLQAEASDDFGLLKYGVGFGIAGEEPKLIELGQSAPSNTKRQFDYLIPLERLGVDVDQAVSYFAWADDYGPDGKPRRTFSDMFFAEVRPFDEIFRQDQSGSAEGEGGSQGGGGNARVKLAQLQKQIVVATWNLEREKRP